MTVYNAGTIAVDTNPNLLAVTELDGSGNLIHQTCIDLPRVMHAKHGKRQHDILIAAKEIVAMAVNTGKYITIENLYFGKRKALPKGEVRNRWFNRMRGNFCYRQLLETIEREAAKAGVKVTKVFAGYTSILGIAKYAKMYSLNRHTAAAICIGRRGMGITKERQNFKIETIDSKTDRSSGNRLTPRQESSDSSGTKLRPEDGTVCVRLRPKSVQTPQGYFLRGCQTQDLKVQRSGEMAGIISPRLEPGKASRRTRHIVASGKGNRPRTKPRPSMGEAVP